MDAIDELAQLADSICQASALLANEDVNENSSSSRRLSTFLNVVALGNTRGKRICKIASSNADDSYYRKCIEPRYCLRYYSVSKLKDFTGREKPPVIT